MAIQTISNLNTATPTGVNAVTSSSELSERQSAREAPEAEATARSAQAPSREQVSRAMNEVRQAIDPVARNLQFSIDEDTGRTVVKVVDVKTKEVIRQIPSEELLAMSRSLESNGGLLVKEKA